MLDLKEEKTIANIEKELARLWDEQKEKKQTKASLFNLILYTHESRRTAYFRKMVQAIIDKFPSRIIFIEGKRDANPGYIHVSVSTETSGTEGSIIACDQITIETSFQQLNRVPFIVMPHLVPDLPIYLLWGQDPTSENELLPAFQKFATRLIFDSECTENLQHFSKEMLKKLSLQKMDFMDMHWALIKGWRKTLATVFDTQEKHEQLRNAKGITITYNSRKTEFFQHYETQSIYLQGWLAAQMEWNYDSMEVNKNRKIRYTNGVEVTLCPSEYEAHPSGAILRVDVHCEGQVEFSISREKIWSKSICHISYPESCEIPHLFPMPDLERGFNFMREVFFSKPSNHYNNMLKVIAQTCWEQPCK